MLDAGSVPSMGLTDRDRAILEFERSWRVLLGTATPPPQEIAIRSELDLSPTRYYELLRALAASPDAAAYDPLVIRRLRKSQSRRRRARLEGWPASQPPGR